MGTRGEVPAVVHTFTSEGLSSEMLERIHKETIQRIFKIFPF